MIISDSKKISLHPIEIEDIETIRQWRNDQKIQRFLREYRLFSKKQKETWYSNMLKDNKFEMFTIKNNKTHEIIGACGLTYIDWLNRHADVHVYIGKDNIWVDEEYCPDALKTVVDHGFKTLNLNKLWAEIYEIDIKKINLFKNHGFVVDACLRQHYFHAGKYHNSFILSLLRNECE